MLIASSYIDVDDFSIDTNLIGTLVTFRDTGLERPQSSWW